MLPKRSPIAFLLGYFAIDAVAHHWPHGIQLITTTTIAVPTAMIPSSLPQDPPVAFGIQKHRHLFSKPTEWQGNPVTTLTSATWTNSPSYVELVTRSVLDHEEREDSIKVLDHKDTTLKLKTLVTRATSLPLTVHRGDYDESKDTIKVLKHEGIPLALKKLATCAFAPPPFKKSPCGIGYKPDIEGRKATIKVVDHASPTLTQKMLVTRALASTSSSATSTPVFITVGWHEDVEERKDSINVIDHRSPGHTQKTLVTRATSLPTVSPATYTRDDKKWKSTTKNRGQEFPKSTRKKLNTRTTTHLPSAAPIPSLTNMEQRRYSTKVVNREDTTTTPQTFITQAPSLPAPAPSSFSTVVTPRPRGIETDAHAQRVHCRHMDHHCDVFNEPQALAPPRSAPAPATHATRPHDQPVD